MKNNEKLTHIWANIPAEKQGMTEFLIPVYITGVRNYEATAEDLTEAAEKAKQDAILSNTYTDSGMRLHDMQAYPLMPRDLPDESQDEAVYQIPVYITGIKYHRTMAFEIGAASIEALDAIKKANQAASIDMKIQDMMVYDLVPKLALKPSLRENWPYWGYGWTGTDGIDWRAYRTNKGPGSIPDIAEESWPIAPFDDRDRDTD